MSIPTAEPENLNPEWTASLTYLGHASLLIETRARRLLTDPVFSMRIFHLRRTARPPEESIPAAVDAILISHLHYDHLDIPSLQRYALDTPILAPKGAGKLIAKLGFTNCQEMQVGDEACVGEVRVHAVFADHVRSRNPLGMEADCLGYVVEGDIKVYYPGDTRLFNGMGAIAADLDAAFLPVWGWGPDRGKMHMGPLEAAQAAQMLAPRLAIPIHWGTYLPIGMGWFNPAFNRVPPLEFARQVKRLAPEVEVKILPPGGRVDFSHTPDAPRLHF